MKALNLSGFSQGTPLAVTTSASFVDITETADYSIWCDIDVYIKINSPTSPTVTVDNGWALFGGSMPPPIRILAGSRIQVIAPTGSGTFRHHKLGVL